MPGGGRPPDRRLSVLFLGAGASKAARLPLTEELLERIYPRSGAAHWHGVHSGRQWQQLLRAAITVLYPDGDLAGFRPTVSDFFMVLEVVAAIHGNRERLPIDADSLLRDLRLEIAHGLHSELQGLRIEDTYHARWMSADNRPEVVLTSNWDTVAERAAQHADLTTYLTWPRDRNGRRKNVLSSQEIVVLKLHGSIDWGPYAARVVHRGPRNSYYSDLATPIGDKTDFGRGLLPDSVTLRFRSLEGARERRRRLTGFRPPLMATMARSKGAPISALEDVWDDAYWTLSRAERLDIVGYSFPDEDLELRTLLRASTRQAGHATLDRELRLTVFNPSPDAHEHARSFLGSQIRSNYEGAEGWVI